MDAESGRFVDFGDRVLDNRLDAGWDVAVVMLGNNYGADKAVFSDYLTDIVDRLAPRPTVLLTVTEFRPDRADVNEAIYEIAADYENVRVVDWAAETADDPALVGGDGLHLSDLGRARYADVIGTALGRAPGFGEGDCLGSDFTDDSAVIPVPGPVTPPQNNVPTDNGGGGGGGATTQPAPPTTVPTPDDRRACHPSADHGGAAAADAGRRRRADDGRRPTTRSRLTNRLGGLRSGFPASGRPDRDLDRRPPRTSRRSTRRDAGRAPTSGASRRHIATLEPVATPTRKTHVGRSPASREACGVLQAVGLAVSVGGRLVVEGADFTVMAKDKVGLVGRNGAGKTSLFRVLGGHAEPAAGRVIRKGGFGYLPQDPRVDAADDARTAVTHVLSGRGVDAEIERIEKLRIAMEEHPSERAVARYSRAEELFRSNGGYAAESEARAIAAGLGLDDARQNSPIGVLSGGERRRTEIARILFAGSDVLLLDEPTNHLDVDAKEWLLGFLRGYRGALLVISHDLELLDEAITRVLHLDRPGEAAVGTVVEYRGTYSQYVRARAEDERRAAKVAARQGKEIARLQAVVDRFGAKATKAAMAHSIEKRISRIEEDRVEVRRGDRTLQVKLPGASGCRAHGG